VTKKLGKDDIKGPDSFIATSDVVGLWIQKNRKLVFSVLGGLLVIGAAAGGWSWYLKFRETRAQEALYEVESKIYKIQADLLSKNESTTQKDGKDTKIKASDKNIDSDYGSLLGDFDTKIKSNMGSKAALIGSIQLASIYMEYENFDKAHQILKEISPTAGKNGVFFGLVQMQLASVLAAMNKQEEAKALYDQVLKDKGSSFLHSEAILKLGLMEEKLGRLDQAKTHYLRASQEFSATDAGKAAKAYLRLIELDKTGASR
jgi:predicted negative regulator of RcsB-dependent stress response